jgi:probable rRNA maturation factor
MGRPTRLHVNVSTPDGAVPASRGLAGWLTGIAPAAARGEVTVAIVSDRRMRVLNRTFRGKDYATDVLAFAVEARGPAVEPRPASPVPLGDIVIAAGIAARQARDQGHATGTEIKVLALHGLLHLLGYDHEDAADGGRMARAEARLRRRAGLPMGLIGRGSAAPRVRTESSGARPPAAGSKRRS